MTVNPQVEEAQALPILICVTSGKWFTLSEPQFPPQYYGGSHISLKDYSDAALEAFGKLFRAAQSNGFLLQHAVYQKAEL